MLIPEEIIEKIREENDIVDIISETVRLKRRGRNYIGLCPFHNEKTPSFTVSQDKQIFKCFGCGEVGNVITFLMKTKGLPFPEACELLADRANIDISVSKGNENKDTKKRLYDINIEAARFFFENLKNNKKVISYLSNRGLTGKTIAKFGLGYAKDNWSELFEYLKRKGYSETEIFSLGLIIKGKNDKFYDRFRNRVIFPVFNPRGKVIGFGGRVLDDSKPKYLNSPESKIFNKGTNLYGLNLAIKNNQQRILIIVEGYMDCISLHQSGITNVVASLGTALTIGQAKLMKKYADTIYIAYDADVAGQVATLRGLDILMNEGFDLRVVTIPYGKDPDDYVKSHGKEGFLQLLEDALPLVQYKIEQSKKKTNFKDQKSLSNFINEISEILIGLDPVERNLYVKQISEEINISEDAIYDFLNQKLQKNTKNTKVMNITGNIGTKLYLEEPYMKAERTLLNLMINKIGIDYIITSFNAENIINDSHKNIFELIKKYRDLEVEELKKKVDILCQDVETSKELINILEIELLPLEDEGSRRTFINDCFKEIKKSKLEESKKEVMNKIKHFEESGVFEETLKYVEELSKIDEKLRNL
ncbi:DNA primase [Hathewaya massiliensis]|uniref:DNA primase n=1 Tax=Hathewaya massiliensis TaxID=1964382 RepID=UPI0011598DDA|nr:DNA primase [Hathewaya massiliensis]